MKSTYLILCLTLLASVILLSSCCYTCDERYEPTLRDKLRAKSFVVKNVTQLPQTNVTQHFKDLKFFFNIDASKCFLKMSAASTDTLTSVCTISEAEPSTVTFSPSPTHWGNTLQEVALQEYVFLYFKININHPILGSGDYYFQMWQQ